MPEDRHCRRDKFEWVPALHTFLGGVFTDEHCEAAGVKGLYASGESGTGTHGANRLQSVSPDREVPYGLAQENCR